MNWSTKVTSLLGCRYPIIGGSYAGFGNSSLAAPVSAAGGFGLITAGALKTPEALRADIRKARSMTDKPFGVNISAGLVKHPDEMAQVAIEERVAAVETSVMRAADIGKRVKDAGIVWFHKVSTVEHALAAERDGADAVVIVGIEGTGFKNVDQLPTLTTITWAAKRVRIPIIAAGGIADAHGFLGVLAMGAEAAYLGTALMATTECQVSDRLKQQLVREKPTDREVRDRALAPPSREELEKVMRLKGTVPTDKWLRMLETVNLKQSLDAAELPIDGPDQAFRIAGGSLAVACIDRIMPVGELIGGIIREAEEIIRSKPFFSPPSTTLGRACYTDS